jgi:hypothetical protein
MDLKISCTLACSAERALQEVMKPTLMQHIAQPLVYFSPLVPAGLPAQWQDGGVYPVRLRLFGWLPFGTQTIRTSGASEETPQGPVYRLRDNGYSRMIKVWDHGIAIRSVPRARPGLNTIGATAHCTYTDTLKLHAGIWTPFIWLFAQGFYRWRQRRWQRLIKNNFEYK